MFGKKLFWSMIIFLLSLSVVIGAIGFFPTWRESIQLYIHPNKRLILSHVQGDLTGKGDIFSFVKVLTPESLSIEIYQARPETSKNEFVHRLVLPEKREGHFTFRGNATSLALVDVDQDGTLEIVAPAYDENLVPRLRVFKYEPANGSFNSLNSSNFKF